MSPNVRRNLVLGGIALVLLAVALTFPRFAAAMELAARELRYYWWMVLLVAVAGWLVFFTGRKDR